LLIAIRHIGGNTTGYLISEHSSRPALIVYSMSTTTIGVRRRRDTSAPKRHHSGGGRKHNQKTGGQQQHRTAPPPVRQLCQRHSVYVDFSELNWQDWILAPNGYEAFYCDGACHYPLGGNHNVTNHAIVQSLVNSVSRNAAPPPCCVPTETEQLAILYIDINNRIIIKNYPEMKVIGCGCR
jgi:bone morphogenetic protein 2/4